MPWHAARAFKRCDNFELWGLQVREKRRRLWLPEAPNRKARLAVALGGGQVYADSQKANSGSSPDVSGFSMTEDLKMELRGA